MPNYQILLTVSVPDDDSFPQGADWWADAAAGALHEYGAETTYAPIPHPEAIAVSLGDGNTYESFARLFDFIAGQTEWQRRVNITGADGGLNVALNGDDVQIVSSEDDGMRYKVPLDNEWIMFGPPQFIPWEAVSTIVIF
jgi:hypothetical protein